MLPKFMIPLASHPLSASGLCMLKGAPGAPHRIHAWTQNHHTQPQGIEAGSIWVFPTGEGSSHPESSSWQQGLTELPSMQGQVAEGCRWGCPWIGDKWGCLRITGGTTLGSSCDRTFQRVSSLSNNCAGWTQIFLNSLHSFFKWVVAERSRWNVR